MAIGGDQLGHAWTESSINVNAPHASGVYAIYSAVWIYIGESNDIQSGLLEIWNGTNVCITRAIPTAFEFEVCDLAERVRRQVALDCPISAALQSILDDGESFREVIALSTLETNRAR